MHKLYEQFSLALSRVLTLSREDLSREDGQGATEYGLVIAFVVLGLGIALAGLGTAITGFLGDVATAIGNIVVP
jgi:Flp pilus assembly pilin Flp